MEFWSWKVNNQNLKFTRGIQQYIWVDRIKDQWTEIIHFEEQKEEDKNEQSSSKGGTSWSIRACSVEIPEGEGRKEQKKHLKKYWVKTPNL